MLLCRTHSDLLTHTAQIPTMQNEFVLFGNRLPCMVAQCYGPLGFLKETLLVLRGCIAYFCVDLWHEMFVEWDYVVQHI